MDLITLAKLLPGYRLRLRFADGAEGIAEFAPLVEKRGVSAAIASAAAAVRIGPRGRSVEWPRAGGETVDFCADALRLGSEARLPAAG